MISILSDFLLLLVSSCLLSIVAICVPSCVCLIWYVVPTHHTFAIMLIETRLSNIMEDCKGPLYRGTLLLRFRPLALSVFELSEVQLNTSHSAFGLSSTN